MSTTSSDKQNSPAEDNTDNPKGHSNSQRPNQPFVHNGPRIGLQSNFETVLIKLGGFGAYQRLQWAIMFLGMWTVVALFNNGFNLSSHVPLTESECFDAREDKHNGGHRQFELDNFCTFVHEQSHNRTLNESCSWNIANSELYLSTAVTVFNASFCADRFLQPLLQYTNSVGQILGALLFGQASAFTGYRWSLLCACVLSVLSGLLGIVALYIIQPTMFFIASLINGASSSGVWLSSTIIMTEICVMERRFFMLSINGHELVAPVIHAIVVSTNPNILIDLILGCSILFVMIVLHFMYVRDSPRWLLARGRVGAAKSVISLIKDKNNCRNQSINCHRLADSIMARSQLDWTIIGLLRNAEMRRRTAVFIFTAISSLYLSAAIDTEMSIQFHGTGLMSLAQIELFSMGVSIAGIILAVSLDRKYGRMTIFSICLFNVMIACTVFLVMREIDAKTDESDVILCIVLVLSRVLSWPVEYVVFLQSIELSPTSLRSLVLGMNIAATRMGKVIPMLMHKTMHDYDSRVQATLTISAVLPILNLICGWLFLPETKNTPLADTLLQIQRQPLI